MNKKEIINRLKNDEDYYGSFGKQYLSNSDIQTLLSNPLALHKDRSMSSAFLVGGYFHTAILEPDKLKKYKIIKSSSRNTKIYKELSGGEMCLLQDEVDRIELMLDKVNSNRICVDLIRNANVEYETPGITELFGNKWKGKADIINHDDKVIIDLKTTNDLDSFRFSAKKYNYDSQAYIYSHLFGYEFMFIVVDKNTHQIGLFDCSTEFLERGQYKVEKASEVYDLFYKSKDFDPNQYFINQTL
tara:strand:- start:6184 stop:6915 length:732 start_codon:yes stop_codon:yes gene_type:complete